MSNSAEPTTRSVFHRIWPVLKWVLFMLVLLFVGDQAWQLWREGDVGSVRIRWPWLLAACGLYVVGWLPSVLFWKRLIQDLRGTSSLLDVAHAFFAGHLGKYIPGKASVLLIRAGMLANRGCRPGLAALTSTYETLVCMGVGAAVGLTLAPIVWPRNIMASLPAHRWGVEHPLAFGLSIVVICILLVPPLDRVLGWITSKFTPMGSDEAEDLFRQSSSETNLAALVKAQAESQPREESFNTGNSDLRVVRAKVVHQMEYRSGGKFLLCWCFAFVVTWLLHGASLGCTLRAVGVETSWWSDWLTWTGDVSSASVLGFLAVFAPGGLGVREGVLMAVLKVQSGISPSQAVAAVALLRVVWLAGEILAAAGLASIARKWRGTNNKKSVASG